MPDLGLTSVIDPYVEGWAKEAGMDTRTLSSIFGGNMLGGLISVPLDMFLTDLGSKIAQAAIGGAGLLLGTYPLKGQSRIQLDVMQLGARLFSDILDPSPQQIKEIQKNIGDAIDGFVQGRWDKVAYAIFRNPRELSGLMPSTGTEKKVSENTADQTKHPLQPVGIVYKL